MLRYFGSNMINVFFEVHFLSICIDIDYVIRKLNQFSGLVYRERHIDHKNIC